MPAIATCAPSSQICFAYAAIGCGIVTKASEIATVASLLRNDGKVVAHLATTTRPSVIASEDMSERGDLNELVSQTITKTAQGVKGSDCRSRCAPRNDNDGASTFLATTVDGDCYCEEAFETSPVSFTLTSPLLQGALPPYRFRGKI